MGKGGEVLRRQAGLTPRRQGSNTVITGLPAFAGNDDNYVVVGPQLDTSTTEIGDFSKMPAAVSPKNRESPGRRLTPMMIRLWPSRFASVSTASSGDWSARTRVAA